MCEIVERLQAARLLYQRQTGRLPTRAVLSADDFFELSFFLRTHNYQHPSYIHVMATSLGYTPEPEILGMKFALNQYAKESRVYFQES